MSPGPSACSSIDGLADRLDLVARFGVVGRRRGRGGAAPAGRGSRRRVVEVVRLGRLRQQRLVAHLHRVRPAGHLDDRRVAEVPREPLRIDRGARDDELQIRPAGQELLEDAEDEVDVQASFVGLVDDDRVVLLERPVVLHLGQQDAVGHHLDQRVGRYLVAESHLVADGRAEFGADLLGDAVGDRPGGDPARLRVADQAVDAAAEFEADLRQLGGLARAGLAGHDHHLVVADRGGDVVLALRDRQFRRVRDGRYAGGTGGSAGDRRLDGGRDGLDGAGLGRHGAHAVRLRCGGRCVHDRAASTRAAGRRGARYPPRRLGSVPPLARPTSPRYP